MDRSVYRIKDMNPNKIFLYDYSRLRKFSLLLDLGPTYPPADTSVPPSHLGLVAPLSMIVSFLANKNKPIGYLVS